MTTRIFACTQCKKYINAGKRWCFDHLEQTGVVHPGEVVDVDRVLAATDYWCAPDPATQSPSGWLNDLLPQVEAFLLTHRAHHPHFGVPADDDFAPEDPHQPLVWDDVQIGEPFDISAATLVRAGYKQWSEVESYMRQRELPIWWWGHSDLMMEARTRFQDYVEQDEI